MIYLYKSAARFINIVCFITSKKYWCIFQLTSTNYLGIDVLRIVCTTNMATGIQNIHTKELYKQLKKFKLICANW
ncbi:hypothetical protein [Clostridium sardiniense]|uniref:hypothetical protein n=1 Tax=Clostridium sardiniense TaxID=29369 RepID=UPI001FAEF9FF|nr:hypothetical protein [Clostridium sardiniense]